MMRSNLSTAAATVAAAAASAPREIIEISLEDSDAAEDSGEEDRGRKVIEIDDSASESEDLATSRTRSDRGKRTIVDLTGETDGGRECPSGFAPRRVRRRAKPTTAAPSIAPATASSVRRKEDDGAIWERLDRILSDPRCSDEPAGPSQRENDLLSNVAEFGITPYRYEVPLGNGVSDCVGHDANGRLCVVEAKCIRTKAANKIRHRRAKVVEQTRAYATFLSQETRADVAAYSFDDQSGMVALQSFGIFEYEKVKNHHPRGRGALAKKAGKATEEVKRKNGTENKKRKKEKKEKGFLQSSQGVHHPNATQQEREAH